MKTIIRNFLVTILVAMPFLFVSCEDGLIGISGDGEVVKESLDVDFFDGFVLAIAAEVFVSQGEEQKVLIEAQQNIIDNLDLDDVRNGNWKIKNYRWVRNSKPIKIYITVPKLTEVGLSGSGEILGETKFDESDKLDLSISGSGKIDLDTDCDELNLRISGSGDLYLAGSTDLLDCSISGSGGIHAYDMTTRIVDIRVSGSGNTRILVDESLKVSISGSGSIFYRGTPEIDSHISGSGRIKHDN